jgi:hypothetical protein
MAGGAETPNIAALPAIARLGACESARGPDADRRVKLLIQFAVEGSHSGAYSHLRFDLVEGRSESEIRKILDATHEVLLETLKVPKYDRYQVVHEHKRSRMIVEDTGLGFVRSDDVLLLQVTSRPRSREMKENFYRLLVERLATR